MKTRLLFILLFLGGVLFFGCKKDNPPPPYSPQISMFTGTYLVSGYSRVVEPPPHGGTATYDTVALTNDTLVIASYDGASRTVTFTSRTCWYCYSFNTPPMSEGNGSCLAYNDPTLYYNFFYEGLPCPTPPIPATGYTLSYQKNNVDTIYVHAVFSNNDIFLSGVKIHQ